MTEEEGLLCWGGLDGGGEFCGLGCGAAPVGPIEQHLFPPALILASLKFRVPQGNPKLRKQCVLEVMRIGSVPIFS